MKKILINATPWQTRIAVTRERELQNIYFSTPTVQTLERTYFKGVVTKVLPGIQTAFVDIGQEKAGFLHISEIDRDLAIRRMSNMVDIEDDGEHPVNHHYTPPDMSKILHEGENILVQVSKEPVYEKGAKLTTCFTLPGRFIVLMPNIPRIAISKKIEDREERARLKEIALKNLPEGMGCIIRTSCEKKSEKELAHDMRYLVDIWQEIQKNYTAAKPQEKIYQDLPLALQIVRDHLDDDVDAVICDDKEVQREVYKFIKHGAPEFVYKVKLYEGKSPLFETYQIEQQIEEALAEKVNLKSGGSIIVESTQAMTVVDVNTGRFTGKSDLEETIVKTNLEAAEEVTRQLRLRNIGGLIVIDFIDMSVPANRQKVFRFFERMLRERDKFQSVVLKISEFGLVQMTRKRSGKTLVQELTKTCEECSGRGFIKSVQSEAFEALQNLKAKLDAGKVSGNITLVVHPKLFDYLVSTQYTAILALEKEYQVKIVLSSNGNIALDHHEISFQKQ
jgi:ribonuclease G